MIPLSPEVAREAEVDWGRAWVVMSGERRQVKLFWMRSRISLQFPTSTKAIQAQAQEIRFAPQASEIFSHNEQALSPVPKISLEQGTFSLWAV